MDRRSSLYESLELEVSRGLSGLFENDEASTLWDVPVSLDVIRDYIEDGLRD